MYDIKIRIKGTKTINLKNMNKKTKFNYGPIYFMIPYCYIDIVKNGEGYSDENGLEIEYINCVFYR